MMNPILKELVILEVKDYLTDEALADFASKEYNIEGAALVAYININYVELFDNPAEKTKLILEDDADGYSIKAMISEFEDAYQGYYETAAGFAQNWFTEYCDQLDVLSDYGILYAIDWDLYWTSALQFDYYDNGGYYFRNL